MKKVQRWGILLLVMVAVALIPAKQVAAGYTQDLGGMDLYSFCRHIYVSPPGNYEWINNRWYCVQVINDIPQAYYQIDMHSVCRWQYDNWGYIYAWNPTGGKWDWKCRRYVDTTTA